MVKFKGLTITQYQITAEGKKFTEVVDEIRFDVRDNKFFSIYSNREGYVVEEYFNLELIDENTIKLINKGNNRTYILNRKSNN